MSLLMDALKKAEASQGRSNASAAAGPASELSLEAQAAPRPEQTPKRDPRAAEHGATGASAATRRPGAAAAQEAAAREAARGVFAAKQAPARQPLALFVAAAALAGLLIGAYFWWQLQTGRQSSLIPGGIAGTAAPRTPAAAPTDTNTAPATAAPLTPVAATENLPLAGTAPPPLAATTPPPLATTAPSPLGETASPPLAATASAPEVAAPAAGAAMTARTEPAATRAGANSPANSPAAAPATPSADTRTATAASAKAAPRSAAAAPSARSAAARPTAPAGAAAGEPALLPGSSASKRETPLQQGYLALQEGRFDEAQRHYAQALQGDPRNVDALLGLALIASRQGRGAQAESLYLRALDANPADPDAQAGLINLRGQGDPQQAESRLKTLLASQPESSALHFALGNLLSRQSRWAEAQQAYFRAWATAPENADIVYNLAVSLDHLRQNRLAAQHYRMALDAATRRPAAFDRAAVERRLAELQP